MSGADPLEAPQPGGRPPAPGSLALVQAFLNTHYDLTAERGGEVLVHSDALVTWLATHGLIVRHARLRPGDLERALAVREGLRALAFANNGESVDAAAVERLQLASAGAFTEIHLEPGGPVFHAGAAATVDAALGVLLATTARAMLEGSWTRLKACPGRECGWAFYDHSKNQSARWCSMKVCGDREKARTYYRRHIERGH
jgi:predicted RNA-binding Zn ribbon-like protein